jgi:hypothetical protein
MYLSLFDLSNTMIQFLFFLLTLAYHSYLPIQNTYNYQKKKIFFFDSYICIFISLQLPLMLLHLFFHQRMHLQNLIPLEKFQQFLCVFFYSLELIQIHSNIFIKFAFFYLFASFYCFLVKIFNFLIFIIFEFQSITHRLLL